MPTARIRNDRFRECRVNDEATFMRAFGQALRERGFRLDMPMEREFADEDVLFSQETPPGRVPNNHPQLFGLLQRIRSGDATAIQPLAVLLLTEADDRFEVLEALEVEMPANADGDMGTVCEDFGTTSERKVSPIVAASVVVEREICRKVALLFGLREEAI